MPTRVIDAGSGKKALAAASEGAEALRKGKLVGFATETVYGIAAVATRGETMSRLRELKSRPDGPFSVHLGEPAGAARYVRKMPDSAARLIARAWPGPVTVLVPTGGKLADRALRRHRGLYDELVADGFIGLRCPDEPVARAMLGQVALPVVAPSANPAGQPSPRTADEVLASLDGRIDLLIDSGPTRYGKDSTIVRCEGSGWIVLRKGVHDANAIKRLLKRTVLFVCTGNTCRSPMAAGLARKILAGQFGCKPVDLAGKGIEVLSAGAFAAEGGHASREAIAAARRRGVDISRHRSRKLTRELIDRADLVFCMTDAHVAEAARLAPDARAKVCRLDPKGDVADPIGGGAAVYRRTAERIEKVLRTVLSEGLP